MHKQWNIISRDFPGLERNPGIKIPVKMTRDPGNPGSRDRTPNYHPICAEMPLYYMVRYASSGVSFVCKLCTELCKLCTLCKLYMKVCKLCMKVCKLCTESHWTETVHLFKDCYPNLIDIENPLDKNETDERVETESISPTNLSNSEESLQNFEDTSSTQE